LFLGTPKGRREFHSLYLQGEQGVKDWAAFPGKTIDNPAIDPEEVIAARAAYERIGRLDLFLQEYEGVPADDGGNPFGVKAIASCFGPQSHDVPVCFGLDLAKSQDWTWLIGLDDRGRMCFSERWQSDWRATKRRVIQTVGNIPTLLDSTGVGDPILEDLQASGGQFEGFKFSQTSKQQLMEGLAAALQGQEISIFDDVLRGELESFEFEYVPSGVRYSAPEGLHDDGVCALALAVRHRMAAVRGGHFYFSAG
jgi:hypothetical protein